MAPIQAIWARDNRGVMIRLLGAPGDPATHLENRAGEPLANPYLYMAAQIHAGLDGIARRLDPGPSADAPYETTRESPAEPLPGSLAEALAALDASDCMRAGFGDAFVDYHRRIKLAEIARSKAAGGGDAADVTDWEHREYFDLA
jgi:glutamine synthetase